MSASFGCVVLTQGRRPNELARALDSLLGQKDVNVHVAVVGNGWIPTGLPTAVKTVGFDENIGAPAGRNAGAAQARGDFLLFMDDDAYLPAETALAQVAKLFISTPDLGAVQLRIADPDGRPGPREWVPRLRVGDRTRSSEIVPLCEGAVVVRRQAFERAGGWPDRFFLHHEGIDLGWRIWDAGFRAWYAGDIVALHPADPARGSRDLHYLGARNRVWLARRLLPLPLAVGHVAVWLALTAARLRSARDTGETLRGVRAGLTEAPGERKPLRWRTVWQMTRAGRPPII
jgi:GT2 family glycosyltransferase